jgi:DNA-binding Xre family transcriptional regulator
MKNYDYEQIRKRFVAEFERRTRHGDAKYLCRRMGISYTSFLKSLKEGSTKKIELQWFAFFCEELDIDVMRVLYGSRYRGYNKTTSEKNTCSPSSL